MGADRDAGVSYPPPHPRVDRRRSAQSNRGSNLCDDPLLRPPSSRSTYRTAARAPDPLIYHVPRLVTPDQRDREEAEGKPPRLAQRFSGVGGNRAHPPSMLVDRSGRPRSVKLQNSRATLESVLEEREKKSQFKRSSMAMIGSLDGIASQEESIEERAKDEEVRNSVSTGTTQGIERVCDRDVREGNGIVEENMNNPDYQRTTEMRKIKKMRSRSVGSRELMDCSCSIRKLKVLLREWAMGGY